MKTKDGGEESSPPVGGKAPSVNLFSSKKVRHEQEGAVETDTHGGETFPKCSTVLSGEKQLSFHTSETHFHTESETYKFIPH